MFKVVKLFNLFKRVIIFFVMLPYLCRRKSGVAVPINILICLVRIYMLTVFNVKSAVIMLGIVNAIFSSSAVMPCQFHPIVFSPFVQFSI